MKKVIVIIRESTIRQEIESQKDEIVNYVLSEGYRRSEIVVIGEAGSSALKLDETYLRALNKVYQTIEKNPSIKCVYAWAIDRIGRNEEVLMNFKNFLISKKINLRIKNPNLSLLNDDGTINLGMELAFSLYATMSKQEMEQKKQRFKRAKARNKKEGKFNGGTARFGYGVENGYFVVNKEEADIVRLIFEEYSTGNYSMQKLADELNSRGIRNRGNLINVPFIHKLLTTTDYIGEGNKAAILDVDLFNKCENIRNNQTSTLLSKESKTIHLATKILKCRDCGTNYIANFDRYVCYKHRFSKRFTEGCENNLTIRIDVLDELLWDISYKMHKEYLSIIDEDKVSEVLKDIDILELKINECNSKLEKMKVRKQRIVTLYTDGITDTATYKQAMSKYNADVLTNKAELDTLKEKLASDKDILKYLENPISEIVINSDADKKAIVNKHIKELYIERAEKGTKIVINGISYLYNPYKNKKPTLLQGWLIYYNIAEKHNIANATDAPIIKPSLIISNCNLLNSFIIISFKICY